MTSPRRWASRRASGLGRGKVILLPLAVFSLLLAALSTGTARGDVRRPGPEASFAAVASGPKATSWNPANLALFPERRMELFTVQAGFGNNSFSMADYARLNGTVWSESDKREILSAIGSSELILEGEARLRAAGFSFGSLAFSTETRGSSRLAGPRELLELLLYGNTVGETFELDGAEAEAIAFTEVRFSMARPIESFVLTPPPVLKGWCAGATVKLLQGWAYAKLDEASGGVTTTQEAVYGSGYFRSVTARGGWGFGIDLGFSGPVGRDWVGSVAIRDLFATIRWTKGAEERIDSFDVPGLSLGDVDEDMMSTESVTRSMDSVQTSLPTVFSLGVARQGERLLTACHLEVATGSRLGASGIPRLSVGAAWESWRWLVIRGTAELGGIERAELGGGAGVAMGPVQLDLGLHSWGSFNPFDSRGLGLVLGLGMSI